MDKVALVVAGLVIGVAFFVYESWNADNQSRQKPHSSRGNYNRQREFSPSRQEPHSSRGNYNRQREFSPSPECSICQELMEKANVFKGPCGHKFHSKCIQDWIRASHDNKTCPLCRKPIRLTAVS